MVALDVVTAVDVEVAEDDCVALGLLEVLAVVDIVGDFVAVTVTVDVDDGGVTGARASERYSVLPQERATAAA